MKARFLPLLILGSFAGCVDSPDEAAPTTSTAASALATAPAFHREHVRGDLYHYTLDLPAGRGANAVIRVHRVVREIAPFVPRHATSAAMLLHGDFSTFTTNFVPSTGAGLAPYLAGQGVDVWGVDRRWTTTATDGDLSDFGGMGVAQDVSDIRTALAFARATRIATGDGGGALALVGFSHGAQLAYTYAAMNGAPDIDALVALDFYGGFGAAEADVRAATCDASDAEYGYVADGETDSPNDFFIEAGTLARTAPDDSSPLFDGLTNRAVMLTLVGQTYQFASYAPFYHLLAPTLDGDGNPTGLRSTTEATSNAWLEHAPPHESMLEAADLDALLCSDGARPVSAPLANIRVPLLYIGAAGGVGQLGVAATTKVRSRDVTTMVVSLDGGGGGVNDPDRPGEYGHGDLLFAADAEVRAWRPLAAWLAAH
jgi:hypothetical protein